MAKRHRGDEPKGWQPAAARASAEAESTDAPQPFGLLTPAGLTRLQQQAGNVATVQLLRESGRLPTAVSASTRSSPPAAVTVQRGVLSFLGDVAKGAGSYLADMGRGAKRTVKGWRFWNEKAMTQMAEEHESAGRLFKRLVSGPTEFFEEMVAAVIGGLTTWASLPEPLRAQASAKFGAAKQDMVNKLIAKQVGKKLVNKLAQRIAARAVQTAVYKTLAKKLGVSAGLSSTGVGIPVSMLSTMGIIEKASQGAGRLRAKYPAVYGRLQGKDMHLAWFLIEPYVPEIVLEVTQAMADMIARTTPDGRVLVRSGGSNDRVPIASGGSGTRVPIASGGSSRRRVPIASGGGKNP